MVPTAGPLPDHAATKWADQGRPFFEPATRERLGGSARRAAREVDRALALNPSYALAINARAFVHIYAGEPLQALPLIEKAIRLDPAQQLYRHFLGTAYFVAGNYETAAAVCKDRIAVVPNTDLSRSSLPCLGVGSPRTTRRGTQDLA